MEGHAKQSTIDSGVLLKSTARIVASYVGRHQVDQSHLAKLVENTFEVLKGLVYEPPKCARGRPAVPIKHSVKPDYIVCLEDGEKLKMLKRHLQRYYGLTPVEYRKRWNLPPDYPMVAPNYAQVRSSIAKETGLGGGNMQHAAE